jgi:hypothetical protein
MQPLPPKDAYVLSTISRSDKPPVRIGYYHVTEPLIPFYCIGMSCRVPSTLTLELHVAQLQRKVIDEIYFRGV